MVIKLKTYQRYKDLFNSIILSVFMWNLQSYYSHQINLVG